MKRKREEEAAAAAARAGSSSWEEEEGGICDDVVRNIFARMPARDAVASMALSRRHRNMITSAEFRRLHCLHGAPLPRLHIAYVATATVVAHRDTAGRVGSLERWADQRASRGFSSGGFAWQSSYNAAPDRSLSYHGFHVAGAGAGRRGGTNPMRALAGQKYDDHKYFGTCNGVILLAVGEEPSVVLLQNPAVADGQREVSVVPVRNRTAARNASSSFGEECEQRQEETNDEHESLVLQIGAAFSDAIDLYLLSYKEDHAAYGAHDARTMRVHPHAPRRPAMAVMILSTTTPSARSPQDGNYALLEVMHFQKLPA